MTNSMHMPQFVILKHMCQYLAKNLIKLLLSDIYCLLVQKGGSLLSYPNNDLSLDKQ